MVYAKFHELNWNLMIEIHKIELKEGWIWSFAKF